MKKTGLKDDYGNPIYDGDTILWTYKEGGTFVNLDGKKAFVPSFPPSHFRKRRVKQKIKYEVRGEMAGYFLDRPSGMGVMTTRETIKCKKI